MKHARITGITGIGALAAGVALAGLAPAASAQTKSASDLRQDIFALEQRISDLEAREAEVPGGTQFEFGGYVKLDVTYDLQQGLEGTDLFDPGSIRFGVPSDGGFNAHTRESRLNFRVTSDTSSGPAEGFIEFDLFGTRGNELISNSHHPRLRHAYVKWNGWTAGQTWSNFMPLRALTPTVDFQGPAGIVFIRQALLQYDYEVSPNFTVAASLENSEFTGTDSDGNLRGALDGIPGGDGVNADLDRVPDFVVSGLWQDGDHHLRGAVVLRELRTPTELRTPGANIDEFGWGLSVSGGTSLWEGGAILGQLNYGDGIGRYIINGVGNDAFIDADGNLDTIEAFGGSIGVTQALGDQFTAALTYGHYDARDTFDPGDTSRLRTVHAGAFYNITDDLRVMGEAIWGERRLADGRTADASRLATAVRFDF